MLAEDRREAVPVFRNSGNSPIVLDHGVEIAVAVEVGEAQRAEPLTTLSNGLAAPVCCTKSGATAAAWCSGNNPGAVALADDDVDIAVAVEVGEARRADGSQIDASTDWRRRSAA